MQTFVAHTHAHTHQVSLEISASQRGNSDALMLSNVDNLNIKFHLILFARTAPSSVNMLDSPWEADDVKQWSC